jgi:hypothetical protein
MGVLDPSDGIEHYRDGIDLHLPGIATFRVRTDTDFADQPYLQAASPGVVKRMYGGAKKAMGVVSDAFQACARIVLDAAEPPRIVSALRFHLPQPHCQDHDRYQNPPRRPRAR